MKKSCILLMTLILCLCAGCSSQPAPDASQTRPETNLFETQVNSVNRAFVAETDLFRYVAALNRIPNSGVLWPDEIQRSADGRGRHDPETG